MRTSVRTDDLLSVADGRQVSGPVNTLTSVHEPHHGRPPCEPGQRRYNSSAAAAVCRPLSESRERVRNYNDGRNERSRKIRRHAYAYIAARLCAMPVSLIYRYAISMHMVSVSVWTLGAYMSVLIYNKLLIGVRRCVGITDISYKIINILKM